ncbi:hypothetical protein HYH03_018617 [Edaphochlamys debaryana]|uniref:Uncharacterized protein n=1 Tax=Edaphochlamys debaryana TaxID=47281 RepID=A0A835XDF9_9CHLO|nr:hypothetical protein HYH03_018617 [Edaphochlamys debaryana]|eukprot:KAG2482447.1 hypothetical protein HYH03_018617 [Edaphochlamys debaryana]
MHIRPPDPPTNPNNHLHWKAWGDEPRLLAAALAADLEGGGQGGQPSSSGGSAASAAAGFLVTPPSVSASASAPGSATAWSSAAQPGSGSGPGSSGPDVPPRHQTADQQRRGGEVQTAGDAGAASRATAERQGAGAAGTAAEAAVPGTLLSAVVGPVAGAADGSLGTSGPHAPGPRPATDPPGQGEVATSGSPPASPPGCCSCMTTSPPLFPLQPPTPHLQYYSPPLRSRDFKQSVGDFVCSVFVPGTTQGPRTGAAWDINTAPLERFAAANAASGPEARWAAVLGDEELLREMQDYFVFAQIKTQGEDAIEPRDIPGTVPVEMVPDLMRAAGFYPSESDIDNLLNHVQYMAHSRDLDALPAIALCDFISLYVNHRPLFNVTAADIEAAFRELGAKGEPAKLTREQLLSLLQGAGEQMSAEELTAALSALTGAPAPDKAMPPAVSAPAFAADVLGFDADTVEGAGAS